MAINIVIVMGRMVADPEIAYTANGTARLRFRLAVERSYRDKKTGKAPVDWINALAWGYIAEFVAKHIPKGRPVVVRGRLQTNAWTTANGSRRKIVEVVCDSVSPADYRRAPKADDEAEAGPDAEDAEPAEGAGGMSAAEGVGESADPEDVEPDDEGI